MPFKAISGIGERLLYAAVGRELAAGAGQAIHQRLFYLFAHSKERVEWTFRSEPSMQRSVIRPSFHQGEKHLLLNVWPIFVAGVQVGLILALVVFAVIYAFLPSSLKKPQ